MLAFPMPRLPSPIRDRNRFARQAESLPLAVHFSQTCFVAPLFSWSYKLLFPQALCFDKHLRCPRVSSPTVHDLQEFTSRTNQLFYRHTVMNSLSSRKTSSAL